MGRQVEVENLFHVPVFAAAKEMRKTLGYQPPVFLPGRSAVQSVEKTQVIIGIDTVTNTGEPATIAGTMWEFNRSMNITFSAPEHSPDTRDDVHMLVSNTVVGLADHFRLVFCRDKDQVYIEDVRWEKSVDASNRTDYVIRLTYRYYDYKD